jgi:hypothetical protein
MSQDHRLPKDKVAHLVDAGMRLKAKGLHYIVIGCDDEGRVAAIGNFSPETAVAVLGTTLGQILMNGLPEDISDGEALQ